MIKIVQSPKEMFQSDDARKKAHASVVESKVFNEAIHAALLCLQYSQKCDTLSEAAQARMELSGAQKFITILSRLSEPDVPARQTPIVPLNPV